MNETEIEKCICEIPALKKAQNYFANDGDMTGQIDTALAQMSYRFYNPLPPTVFPCAIHYNQLSELSQCQNLHLYTRYEPEKDLRHNTKRKQTQSTLLFIFRNRRH